MPRLRPRPAWMLSAVWIALLLAACSEGQPSLPPAMVITAPPVPASTLAATFVVNCEVSALEQWYEVVHSNTQTFTSESVAALELPREDLLATLPRLNDLYDRILNEPVPECVASVRAEILPQLEAIRASYTAYYEDRIDRETLRTRVLAADAQFDTEIARQMEGVATAINVLYRQDR